MTPRLTCAALLLAALAGCTAPGAPRGGAARPADPVSAALLGELDALAAAGRHDEVVARAERALDDVRDPAQRARLELRRGRSLQVDGRLRSAALAFQRAWDALPSETDGLAREVLQAWGDAECALGRWRDAGTHYARALETAGLTTRQREDLLYAAHVAAREAGDASGAARWKAKLRPFSASRLASVEARLLPAPRETAPPAALAGPSAPSPGLIPDDPTLLLPGIHRRAEWNAAALRANVDPMQPVRRITVHHTAMPSGATWPKAVGSEIREIQSAHQGKGWADIGYHFLIDAGGGIWEGRPLRWQGAHEGAGLNQGAIGVCLLGNFDEQPLPGAQRDALARLLDGLSRHFRLDGGDIKTHGEVRRDPTNCPGRALQDFVDAYRRSAGAASIARQ